MQGKAVATPTTLVLDRKGRIAARVSGPVTRATLEGLVDDVLAEG
ncbi:redoxin [Intrasporangium chromatireducens Q5-1]|uniref:Redoxin n=1 Tax=Intrasporangium chromatireducens Q5-1 TaxID=584657 RepID=W9GNB2_9MICO|nr:redoxin [Intrasporangium chromatireducens Q5-1]